MVDRFKGEQNKSKLIHALKRQTLVQGDSAVAKLIADVAEIVDYAEHDTLLVQDNTDEDILLILSGRVSIQVNGREVAIRTAGQHVGEMVLIDPTSRRSASVVALEITVVAKVSEQNFTPIAEQHPLLWRRIAEGMAERLIQRNALIDASNPRPVIFIGSSSESLPIARAIQSGLADDEVLVRVWKDNVFTASNTIIEDLENQVGTSDMAILILGKDDKVISRDHEYTAPRDNVIFELGMFVGSLTRRRTFIVMPKKIKDYKIPSDLLGITFMTYAEGDPDDLPSLIAPVCDEIRKLIRKLGPK